MEQLLQHLQFFFLLRYNLLLLAAFLFLLLGSRKNGMLSTMFGGMFELTPKRAGAVAAAGSMFACFLILTSAMVYKYSPARFGSAVQPQWPIYLLAVLAVGGVLYLAFRLLHRIYTLPSVIVGISLGPFLAVLGANVRNHLPTPGWIESMFRISPQGFLDSGGQVIGDHMVLFYVAGAYLIAYVAMGLWTGYRIKNNGPLPIPALGWVMSLLLLAVLFLNALSFWLDRFHIALLPAGIVCAVLFFGTLGRWIVEHHTYRAYLLEKTLPRPTPSEVLRRAGGKAVVICASGGGIHAGAWAAALLGELTRRSPHFAKHVVLTSSVSGGSVGCLYYVTGLRQPVPPTPERLFEVASTSSLDHVSWGFGFRDLVRFVVPVGQLFRWGNRAWALEKAWRRFADFPVHDKLSDLEAAVAAGKIPASIFNSTIVETGDRFAITTVDLTAAAEPRTEFARLYPGLTIPGVTAAGLSAAFPIVSPSPHIWVHPKEGPLPDAGKLYHLTDGGFYDNYGVVSAIEFLDRARCELKERGEAMPEVLLLRIRGPEESAGVVASPNSFLFQLAAPFKALLAMRSTSQNVRNNVELRLLDIVLGDTCLEAVDFVYPYPDAPLTWHLTGEQKEEILTALRHSTISPRLKQVEDFLKPSSHCANA